MEQVRRNTTEFRKVSELLELYRDSPRRQQVILLYSLRTNENPEDAVLLNKLKKNRKIHYDLNYESVLQNLRDRSQKLFRENRKPLYYFKTSSSSPWISFPFEFTGKLREEVFPLKIVK